MQEQYSKKVMEHFINPRNIGEIKNADGIGQVGNPVCGDILKLYIKVGKKNGREYIKDIKGQTLGCASAIASVSMATEMIKGKYLDEAIELSNKAVAEALGGLPPVKVHCSLLAAEAVKAAIEDYKITTKKSKGKAQS